MSKIIIFTNIKGGTGKSLLCAMFALYCKDKGIPVAVVDADIQQTLYRHRQRELEISPNKVPPYELLPLNTSEADVEVVMNGLKSMDGLVLIDCPGNIHDNSLPKIYAAADIAVIPTRYDEDNLDATLLFSQMFKNLSKAEMMFIPNSINLNEERREDLAICRANAIDKLKPYGIITPRIKQTSVLKNYSTIEAINYYQRNAVVHAFERVTKTSEN